MRALSSVLALAASAVLVAAAAACSSSSGGATGGGPVAGPADTHCKGETPQPVSQDACHVTSDGGTDDGNPTSEYGPTLYGSEADDDDCKYHLAWTSTPVGQGRDVTFTVVVTTASDGKPAGVSTGAEKDADPYAEVYLNDTHPAPPTDQQSVETAPGTYTVGPVRFDAPGNWTVRFHLYETCSDIAEDSPHGHVAFYVQVP